MSENPFDEARRELDEAERTYAVEMERAQREFSAGMARARAQIDEAERIASLTQV